MKNFDWNRFGQVFELDMAMNKKEMTWHMTANALAVITLLVIILCHDTPNGYPYSRAQIFCESSTLIIFILAIMTTLIYVGKIFRFEQKGSGIINLLMLPASNREKFLSRLACWGMAVVNSFLVLFLADALLMIGFLLATGECMSFNAYAFSRMTDLGAPVIVCTISGIFFILALTFLSAVSIKAKYVHSGVGILCGLFTLVATILSNMLVRLSAHTSVTLNIVCICASIFFITAGSIFLYISYRRFCHWQVATHKVFNL